MLFPDFGRKSCFQLQNLGQMVSNISFIYLTIWVHKILGLQSLLICEVQGCNKLGNIFKK